MEITYTSSAPLKSNADLLAIPVYGDPAEDAFVRAVDEALGGRLLAQAATESFKGKPGQSCIAYPGDALPCGAVALIGGGNKKTTNAASRNIGAYAYKVGRRLKAKTLALVLPPFTARTADSVAQMVAEGAVLGSYKFNKYISEKTATEQPVAMLTIHGDRVVGKRPKKGGAPRTLKASIARGATIGAATCHARDMVNEPAEFLNPSEVGNIAKEIAKKHPSVSVKVLGEKECEKLGMTMFLAVGRGSDRESRLIHMTYKPARKAKKVITFVGKGVTFDSGGYSLKPSSAMVDMKIDMGGCAAVVSAMDAIATIGSPYEIHVITACCENLVSGNALLLGDVLNAMDGTTVEVTNTDAEGRLTLGDALTYAQEKTSPDELFDFATLTGASMVALGAHTAGVFSNNEKLARTWLKAADSAGEDMWRMPLNKKLKSQLKSPIADMRNNGERYGGAITAGLFLEHFVKDTAWVHVDLAGPASVNRESGSTMRGGTGFAVASIVEHATR
ncbi:MAG: leucyl aminopeptidase [Myxococcales bacterium]|nr:leucyl aminopeptidase [Myxococcales bacterium]